MSPALLAAPSFQSLDHLQACIRRTLAAVGKPALEPPLVAADIDPDVLAALRPATTPPDDFYKNALESAHKNILYEIAVRVPSFVPCVA